MQSEVTEIIVARHGETSWNKNGRWQGTRDIPLNDRGNSQAMELGEKLRDENIGYIHSSDLSRARETANSVKESTGAEGVFEDSRLRERHLGKFEGWSLEKVAEHIGIPPEQAYVLDVDELLVDKLPTVESWEAFCTRVWEGLTDIAEKHRGEKLLVVAHGGVLRAVSMKLSEESDPKLDFSNTDTLRITYDGGKWSLAGDHAP